MSGGGTSTARREFGAGPLSRAAALVYSLLVLELLLLAATAPGLVLLGLLARDAGSLPLAVLCALPAGPAWSAALYAWHHRGRDLADLHPARAFRRGYRANVREVLKLWAPWLAAMALIVTVLTHRDTAGIPGWWAGLLAVIAGVSALWVTNALVIVSLFTFGAADTARLAGYFLLRSVRGTAGHLCVLAAAVAVTAAGAQTVPLLLASALTAVTLLNCRPMIAEIRAEFTG